jgi:Tol biopolymer transport system component
VSKNGVLAYRAGELQGRRLVWFDRNGKETPAIDEPGDYRDTWLSPDGKRVAFDGSGPSTAGDIWIRDLVRRVTTRFTFDPAVERDPVWSPDSRQIVFTSAVKGRGDLYLKDASATKEAELLFASPDVKLASDWSRDGSYLLFSTQSAETGWDSYALPMKGTNRTAVALLKTKFDELFPTFSPDGHYIVHSSNESGRSEVYAQEFPDARTKSQISTDGGGQPYWSGDGKEIFYRSRTRLMAVPVQTSPTLSIGAPTELFQVPFAAVIVRGHYRPAPDGKRFLVIAALGRDAVKPASVVLNWTVALPK